MVLCSDDDDYVSSMSLLYFSALMVNNPILMFHLRFSWGFASASISSLFDLVLST
jgi:hypothetical protein